MEFEILTGQPLSGEYEEYECGSGTDFIVIKILDDNYSEYCAKFSVGAGTTTKAERIASVLFVVAQGRGYLFDINKRVLIADSEIGNLTNIYASDVFGCFVACNNTDLYVFDLFKLVWRSERISSDGITITSVENSVVKGQVFDFSNWVDFCFNLETFTYVCEWEFPKF